MVSVIAQINAGHQADICLGILYFVCCKVGVTLSDVLCCLSYLQKSLIDLIIHLQGSLSLRGFRVSPEDFRDCRQV